MPRWLKTVLFLLVLGAAGYAVYKRLMPPPGMMGGPGMEAMAPPAVTAAEVAARDVRLWHEFSGRLAAVDSVAVRPRVGGRIDAVYFDDGQHVEQGKQLFSIDKAPYNAAFKQAQALLKKAVAEEKLARQEADRARSLLKDKAVSQNEYDRRAGALDMAAAQVESARTELRFASLDLEYAQVRAPISGRIGRAEVTVGNIVEAGPGAPVLATIVSANPIYADFEMDEAAFLRYLRGGLGDVSKIPVELSLAAETGMARTGRIHSFDNALDPATGTIRVRAVFDNADGALVPGLFAKLLVGSAGEVKTTLVSDRAVSTDQSRKYVLVVGKDGKTEYRPVTLGGMAGGLRVVEEGLAPGEVVVLDPMIMRVRPGMPVKPEMTPMEAGK